MRGPANWPDRFLTSRALSSLIALSERIVERVGYHPGVTEVTSTAAQALELGNGVRQDHAHLMLACCRARGVPARYVSGYIEPGDVPHAASHAWVDVWLDGWVSVDVTHAAFASEIYCRGRPWRVITRPPAPVRGRRIGGREEQLNVSVTVSASTPAVAGRAAAALRPPNAASLSRT